MTALEIPVVVPSSEPRNTGKDVNINNEYDSYDNGQKGSSVGTLYAL